MPMIFHTHTHFLFSIEYPGRLWGFCMLFRMGIPTSFKIVFPPYVLSSLGEMMFVVLWVENWRVILAEFHLFTQHIHHLFFSCRKDYPSNILTITIVTHIHYCIWDILLSVKIQIRQMNFHNLAYTIFASIHTAFPNDNTIKHRNFISRGTQSVNWDSSSNPIMEKSVLGKAKSSFFYLFYVLIYAEVVLSKFFSSNPFAWCNNYEQKGMAQEYLPYLSQNPHPWRKKSYRSTLKYCKDRVLFVCVRMKSSLIREPER